MRLIWLLGLSGCLFDSSSSSNVSERSMAFVVSANVAFEHVETPSGSGEFTEIAEDGSPSSVTVQMTESEEVQFSGTLPPGTVDFSLVLHHVWDGPSDVENWSVSIVAQ